jgi:DNA replication and repair protein RecF
LYISHLSLNNFRNYAAQEIDLSPGATVLCGDNAQGKTNFLEAIYLLATSKSPRASADRELVNWNTAGQDLPFSRLSADVSDENGAVQVEVVLTGQQGSGNLYLSRFKKSIKVNGLARRATDLIGVIRVVMFDPQDTDIVGGSPVLRRRYLDATNSQVDPAYLRNLLQYNKVILQRNHLLRMIKEQRSNPDELRFWDEQLIEAGAYIIDRRLQNIAKMSMIASEIHQQLTNETEKLEAVYLGSVARQTGQDIASSFREALKSAQREEIARGMSVVGPHRDDLRLLVDDVNMCIYGSRGQHRTIALSLKLAQAKYIKSLTDDAPILLLDDVLSELDSERRRRLLGAIEDYQQAIITSTDWDHFDADFLNRAVKFKINQGSLVLT